MKNIVTRALIALAGAALAGILVYTVAQEPAPATEAALRENFKLALTRDGCEASIPFLEQMRARFPDSPYLPEMEYKLGKVWGCVALPENLERGIECFEKFLPGGAYADTEYAWDARFLCANYLDILKRHDEAAALLRNIAATGGLAEAQRAIKLLFIRYLAIEHGEDAAGCAELLAEALASVPDDGTEEYLNARNKATELLGEFRLIAETPDDFEARRVFAKAYLNAAEWNGELGYIEKTYDCWQKVEDYIAPYVEQLEEQGIEVGDYTYYMLGKAHYSRWDYTGCLDVLERYYRTVEKRLSEGGSVDPQNLLRAEQWVVLCTLARGKNSDELKVDLLDQIADRNVETRDVVWAFRILSGLAHNEGDEISRYMYTRDILDLVDNPTTWLERDLIGRMDEEYPNLRAEVEGLRSPAFTALEQAGRIESLESGELCLVLPGYDAELLDDEEFIPDFPPSFDE